MNYKVINKQKILKVVNGIGKNLKKSVLLSGSWKGPYAIASVVFDNVMPKAEVHEKLVDVWYVLKGSGKFILGKELNSPEKIAENEFTGDSIQEGEEFIVRAGDIIDIPAGIAHQVDAGGTRLETIIVKIKL